MPKIGFGAEGRGRWRCLYSLKTLTSYYSPAPPFTSIFTKSGFQPTKSIIPGSDSMPRKVIPIEAQITNGNKAKMSKAEIEQNSSSFCNLL